MKLNRRKFLKTSSAVLVSVAAPSITIDIEKYPDKEYLRYGMSTEELEKVVGKVGEDGHFVFAAPMRTAIRLNRDFVLNCVPKLKGKELMTTAYKLAKNYA